MARPERNNVDYFPFICKEGKTLYFIEQKYANDGYATWIKLLRELAVSNYHFLNLGDRVQMMFIASKCKISEEKLIEIINDLCDLGEFHDQLWKENRIIFSEKFITNIADAYKNRKNKCITLDGLLAVLSDLGIRKLYKPVKKGVENPHTILYYTKVDNTIVEKTPELITLDKKSEVLNSKTWLEKICIELKYPVVEGFKKLNYFLNKESLKSDFEKKDLNDVKDHFVNWLSIIIQEERKVQSGTKITGLMRGQKPTGG